MRALVGISWLLVVRSLVEHTVASVRARVVGAWEDPWVDPRGRLHLDLHLRAPPAAGRQLMLARLAGLAVVDVLVARSPHHAGSVALLVVLAVLANVGALISTLGRPPAAGVQAAALALMALAGGLLAALQHGSAALAFPAVAVVQTVSDGSLLEALAVGALALVGLETGVIWANRGATQALGYPAILLAGALVGLTRRQYVARGRAADALVAQSKRTEAESRRAAALDERTRIAREIHDVLAHALGGLTVQLDAAELLLSERGDVDAALERIRGCQLTAREGLQEARRAVAALRTDAPPLRESLTALLESQRRQGDAVELVVEGSARELSPEASLALMRTVQEALTNARRHAPGSTVQVRLIYAAASTSVIVSNNAVEATAVAVGAAATGGYGLAGMRERLELAGGHLAAGPGPDGWTVSAEIPS
jgi:signal transduction histidine kinase